MTTAAKKLPMKTTAGSVGRPQSLGWGLESMGDLSALLDTPTTLSNGGGPLMLEMNLIDEDPHQPRTENNPGFSVESLDDLAASIMLRGIKTPISVRENPEIKGRYIINHGARRFRGAKRAGKAVVPGFVDNDYNEADQVVENLQRNELTAREIADFIGRELSKGIKKGEIAKAISKSAAFVSQHVTLLDLPDPIAKAFNSNRVKDVTVINELVTAFKRKSQDVSHWLNDKNQEITRGSVKLLREFLDNKKAYASQDEGRETAVSSSERNEQDAKTEDKTVDPSKLKKAIIQVKYNNRSARLILNRRPHAEGFAWLKYDDDGHEFEADLARVKLVALLEG
jgi:ParB family chromosome partitioning protein